MHRELYESLIKNSVDRLRDGFEMGLNDTVSTAIILGTGWADAFPFEAEHKVGMRMLSGPFAAVERLDGHDRTYEIGTVAGKRIIVLRGRVHMNESLFNPTGKLAVRAQIEVLLKLGVKNLVLTAAVGSLTHEIPAGCVVYIDGWISNWAEEMPLFGGEFVSPEMALFSDPHRILRISPPGLTMFRGLHIFWCGPHFESLRDKKHMHELGASCVGMSIKPEATVAALHGVHVIPLGFVTNAPEEVMTHEHHRHVAKTAAPKLGALLTNIVHMLES